MFSNVVERDPSLMLANHPAETADVVIPVARITRAERLAFASPDALARACQLGIFYLAIPKSLDLDSARKFGRKLVDPNNPYRAIPQYGELEGFIALENNQQTKLALRRHHWSQHYPQPIAHFGGQLDELGVVIMREVLHQSGIPEALWSQASGGYASGHGTAFLNFVHYDTTMPDWGLRPHTDYGFVTILDATAPGLQISINGRFEDVPVLPDHFIINFGEALRFITTYSDRPVTAVEHRVVSQKSTDPIRHGIVYFANPDLDGMLWQFNSQGDLLGSSSVEALFTSLEKDLTE